MQTETSLQQAFKINTTRFKHVAKYVFYSWTFMITLTALTALFIFFNSARMRWMNGILCLAIILFFALFKLRGLERKLKRYKEAIACYDKALEIDPTSADAWVYKGLALDNLGQYKEAIACYDKALEISPTSADTWYNKGLALNKLKRYEEAIVCFNRARALNPVFGEKLSFKSS